MTKVGLLLDAAFQEARSKYAELYGEWIRISARVGSKLPHSLLMATMQRDAEVDLLIRCMEDEMATSNAAGGEMRIFALHRLSMMSEYWVGGAYETLRLLRQRKLWEAADLFTALWKDLELVRVPLEKHEIAKDRSLDKPLKLERLPVGSSNDEYIYALDDQTRAHIMPRGVSERGSVTWNVIDLKENKSRWLERRWLSDQMLNLWKTH